MIFYAHGVCYRLFTLSCFRDPERSGFVSGPATIGVTVALCEPVNAVSDFLDMVRTTLRGLDDKAIIQTLRFERVGPLSEGFESAYGMELLASVHWVATHENAEVATDPNVAAELIGAWNARKHRMMSPEHVAKAWSHLHDEHWLPSNAMARRMSSGVS